MANRAGIGLGGASGLKPGKPRRLKKKKGNPPGKTSRSGNGKKIR
jgi:hypothetical protein